MPTRSKPAIRLAPRLAASTAEIGRGVTLDLDAPTPQAFRALAAASAIALQSLPEDAPLDSREGVLFDLTWEHFVIGWRGVTDDSGAPLPCDAEMREAVFEAAPELRWRARVALDEHLVAAREATDEGNGSPA